MKISKYLDIFRHQFYPELFSVKCLDTMSNIQTSSYGELVASQAIYEIHLNKPDLMTDVSFRVYDSFLKNYWLEFDFQNYSSGEDMRPCIFLEPDVFEDHDVLSRAFGKEKWEKFRKPVDDLKALLEDKKMQLAYLGNMGVRSGKFSETIRVEVKVRTYKGVVELLKLLPYSGDIALVENIASEFEPYALKHLFLLSFDMFPDGRISDKVGVTFFAWTSLDDAKDLVQFLTNKSFCTPEQAEAIIRWRSDDLPDDIFIQEICHMKFQFEKEKISAAKLYLRHRDISFFDILGR